MRSRAFAILMVLACWSGRATADDVPSTTPPAAPATDGPTGPTTITGRVTDVLGRPVANARVYVLPRRGQPIQSKTSKDGRYSVDVSTLGTHGVVIAIDRAHTFRTVLVQRGVANALDIDVELDTQGGEVIKIEDRKRPLPKVQPKPTKDPRVSLPYSEEAVERDAWARAWLLLDVDERGQVTRLKLLKAPGFDLDEICIEQALALTFDPALDQAGRPMKTYMLWTMEWPAWGWLIQGNGVAVRRPADRNDVHSLSTNRDVTGFDKVNVDGVVVNNKVGGLWARHNVTGTVFEGSLDRVPCAGSGPLNLDLRNRAYRDCSQPDLRVAEALPWITKDSAATAIAELKNPRLQLLDEPHDPGSPWPGYISASVAGVLGLATIGAYMRYSRIQDEVKETAFHWIVDPVAYNEATKRQKRWQNVTIGLTAASILTGGAALLLWNRNAPRSSFSVQPTDHNGAAASYTTAW
jgi:hypothetical protein